MNFSDIDHLILQYTNAILDAKKKVTHIYKKDYNADHYKRLYWDNNFLQLMRDHEHYTTKALDDLLKLGECLSNKLKHLSDIMPMTSTAKVDQFQATKIHFHFFSAFFSEAFLGPLWDSTITDNKNFYKPRCNWRSRSKNIWSKSLIRIPKIFPFFKLR